MDINKIDDKIREYGVLKLLKKIFKWGAIIILLILVFSNNNTKTVYKDRVIEKSFNKDSCLAVIEKDDYIFDEISKYFGNISSLAGIGDINAFFNGMTIQSNKLTATISSVKQERNALVLKCKN